MPSVGSLRAERPQSAHPFSHGDRHQLAIDELQAHLKDCGVEAIVTGIDLYSGIATVAASTTVDWLITKSELKEKGLTAVPAA
jgi:hypothetical protein